MITGRLALISAVVIASQAGGSASAMDHLPPFEVVGSRFADAVVRVTTVVTEPGMQRFFVTCSLADVDSLIGVTAEGGFGRDPEMFEIEPRTAFFDPRQPRRPPGDWDRTPANTSGQMPPLQIPGWGGYSGPWGASTSIGPADAGTVLHKAYVLFGGVPSSCTAKFNGDPIPVDILVGGYGGVVDLAAHGEDRISRGSGEISFAFDARWKHARLGDGPWLAALSPGDHGSVTLRVPGTDGIRCSQRCARTFPRASAGTVEAELTLGVSSSPTAPFLFFVDLPH